MPNKSGAFDLYLTEVSPRDKPWDVHRAEAQQVEKLYRVAEYNRYADRIKECSRWLGFNLTSANESGEARFRLNQAKFCRVRHCPVCQWRRTLMWCARFFQILPAVTQDYPKARWVFLTLTVKNCPLDELRATVKRMNASWTRLSQRKEFPGIGWVKSLEVTRGEDDQAHPHFHALLMVRSSYFTHGYVKHARWVELWQECMRLDYAPSVRISRVDHKGGRVDITDGQDKPIIDSAIPNKPTEPVLINHLIVTVLETLKYTVKPEDLLKSADPTWLVELTRQLHKTRAIAIGGVLRKYLTDQEPSDEELIRGADKDESEGLLFMTWFGWREMAERYKKITEEELSQYQHFIERSKRFKPEDFEDIAL